MPLSSFPGRFTRRRLLTAVGITAAATTARLATADVVWATAGPSSYTPSWPSVDQHPPAPEWFVTSSCR